MEQLRNMANEQALHGATRMNEVLLAINREIGLFKSENEALHQTLEQEDIARKKRIYQLQGESDSLRKEGEQDRIDVGKAVEENNHAIEDLKRLMGRTVQGYAISPDQLSDQEQGFRFDSAGYGSRQGQLSLPAYDGYASQDRQQPWRGKQSQNAQPWRGKQQPLPLPPREQQREQPPRQQQPREQQPHKQPPRQQQPHKQQREQPTPLPLREQPTPLPLREQPTPLPLREQPQWQPRVRLQEQQDVYDETLLGEMYFENGNEGIGGGGFTA